MNRVFVTAVVNNVQEDEYATYLPISKSRRMGKLQKRALTTALKALKIANIDNPDLIINGTALGCIENSLKILDGLYNEGETSSMPAAFMQSTHNTIASLIAIYTNNHNYNATYSNGEISFECALYDAFLQLKSGSAKTALVCCNDEIADFLQIHPKFFGHIHISDRSEAWVLTVEPNSTKPLFEIEKIEINHEKDKNSAFIQKKML